MSDDTAHIQIGCDTADQLCRRIDHCDGIAFKGEARGKTIANTSCTADNHSHGRTFAPVGGVRAVTRRPNYCS